MFLLTMLSKGCFLNGVHESCQVLFLLNPKNQSLLFRPLEKTKRFKSFSGTKRREGGGHPVFIIIVKQVGSASQYGSVLKNPVLVEGSIVKRKVEGKGLNYEYTKKKKFAQTLQDEVVSLSLSVIIFYIDVAL